MTKAILKKHQMRGVFFVMAVAWGMAAATAHSAPLLLKSGRIDVDVTRGKGSGTAVLSAGVTAAADELSGTKFIIQHDGIITPEWRESLELAGATILGYVPENAYLISVASGGIGKVVSSVSYTAVLPYRKEFRIAPSVFMQANAVSSTAADETKSSDRRLQQDNRYVISLFTDRVREEYAEKINVLPGCQVVQGNGKVIHAMLDEVGLGRVSEWDEVSYVERWVQAESHNNVAVQAPRMNVETVWPGGTSNLGLTGRGQVVAVADTGLDTGDLSTVHEDVRGRIIHAYALSSWCSMVVGNDEDNPYVTLRVPARSTWNDPNGHGTHVAGSVLGNGKKSSSSIRGPAYEAKLIFQSTQQPGLSGVFPPADLNVMFNQAYTNQSGSSGSRIHSNSWGSSVNGEYTARSKSVDEFVFAHPDMLVICSMGNDGIDANGDGVIDLRSIGSPATAKNCVSVGASENQRTTGGFSTRTWNGVWPRDFPSEPIKSDYISRPYDGEHQGVVAFSSRGPCEDGRIKPDVVAPGSDILSLKSTLGGTKWGKFDDYYVYNGGTSMSTPLVSGTAALIRQWLVEKRGIPNPDGATIKALLSAGAKSLYPGQYGTGKYLEIPNTYPNSVEGWGQVNLGNTLANEQGVVVHDGQVIAQGESKTFKVNVASAGGTLAIVMAYADAPGEPSNSRQLVNDLDLKVVSPSGQTTYYPNSLSGPDRVNNVEGVRLKSASAGTYTITVTGYNVNTPMSTSLTGGRKNAIRYSLAVVGATDDPYAGLPTLPKPVLTASGQKTGTGEYLGVANVTCTCSDSSATIRYTTDGSLPTEGNGKVWPSDGLRLEETMTVKACAFRAGYRPSETVVAQYAVTTIPSDSPSALSIDCAEDGGKVVLKWSYGMRGATFNIYRNTDNVKPLDPLVTFEDYAMSGLSSEKADLSYEDVTVTAGQKYFYWVSARSPQLGYVESHPVAFGGIVPVKEEVILIPAGGGTINSLPFSANEKVTFAFGGDLPSSITRVCVKTDTGTLLVVEEGDKYGLSGNCQIQVVASKNTGSRYKCPLEMRDSVGVRLAKFVIVQEGAPAALPDLAFGHYSSYDWPSGCFLSDSSEMNAAQAVGEFTKSEAIYPHVWVLNFGAGTSSAINTELRFELYNGNGQLVNSTKHEINKVLSGVGTTEGEHVVWFCSAEFDLLKNLNPGEYVLKCTIDPEGRVSEKTRDNNEAECRFRIVDSVKLPDLRFVGRSAWPALAFLSDSEANVHAVASFAEGAPIHLFNRFSNQGEAACGDFAMLHEVLDEKGAVVKSLTTTLRNHFGVDTLDVKTQGSWEGKKVTCLQGLSAGAYTYRCTLDPDHVIRESSESNNVVTIDFRVLPAVTYAVTYMPGDAAGVRGNVPPATKTKGCSLLLSAETFARVGYTQTAWVDGDGWQYGLGATYVADASLTLYPVWTANKYLVVFAGDGTEDMIARSCAYDQVFNVTSPTRGGYTFKGWSATHGLNAETAKWGTTVTPSGSISSSSTVCGGDVVYFKNLAVDNNATVTLTANWTENDMPQPVHDVTLNEGWTWISVPIEPSDGSITAVFGDVSFADNDVIKSSDGSATYYGGTWYSGQTSFKLVAGRAYAVKKSTSGSAAVRVSGIPALASLAVSAGWNWIGPTTDADVPLNALTHSGGFTDNDVINSSSGSATYYGGEWYGSLQSLKPGVGYKAKFGKAGALSDR